MQVLSYISLFLLLFDLHIPPFRGIGSAPLSILISSIGLICQYSYRKKEFQRVLWQYRYISLLYFFLLIYVALRIGLNGVLDVSYLATVVKSSTIFVATIVYLASFNQRNLYNKLVNVFFINGLIALLIGTFQEYQPIADFVKAEKAELIGIVTYRNSFIAGSGYFGIGAPFGLALSFFIAYSFTYNKNTIWHSIKLFIILLAGIFAARTVFICVGITLAYLVIFRRNLKIFIFCIALIPLLLYILSFEVFSIYSMWLFEIFSGESATGTELLGNHIKFPENLSTLLIGDAQYSLPTGEYYMNTDIGYLRHLYFGGFFFMINVVFGILYSLFLHNKSSIFLFLIIPVCLILHFKGVFIYNSPTGAPLLVLISTILYNKKHNII